jgi:multisubunit Na+/H+ antiporter MnhF subunit
VNAFLVAGTVLLAGFVPCGWVLVRARLATDALVALELCGTLATLAFLCLALGFESSSYFDVPVVSAVVTWIGSLVFVRFLGRRL